MHSDKEDARRCQARSRRKKISPVAYAENFHGGGFSLCDIWWSFVFGVRRF